MHVTRWCEGRNLRASAIGSTTRLRQLTPPGAARPAPRSLTDLLFEKDQHGGLRLVPTGPVTDATDEQRQSGIASIDCPSADRPAVSRAVTALLLLVRRSSQTLLPRLRRGARSGSAEDTVHAGIATSGLTTRCGAASGSV
jgi:hypothetical protein